VVPRRGRITITYHPTLRADSSLDARLAARDLTERTRTAILSAMPEPARGGTRDRE
jgi:hypothetical protein